MTRPKPDRPVTPEHVAVALRIAADAHHGQVRRFTGEPYLFHPMRVAARFDRLHPGPNRWQLVATALLHDVIEDTDRTAHHLLSAGIPRQVVRSVETLTRRHGEQYSDYIGRVDSCGDPAAVLVKIADLGDNLRDLPADQLQLRTRYDGALLLLTGERP